ncbi:MAG: hypothetical protein ACE5JB_09940 [bacterium]
MKLRLWYRRLTPSRVVSQLRDLVLVRSYVPFLVIPNLIERRLVLDSKLLDTRFVEYGQHFQSLWVINNKNKDYQ